MIMAIDNKDKVLNVPNLRFPEFSEEWKETKIGDITSKVGSGVTPKGGSAVYKTSGHLFIRSQNVGNGCFLLDDVAYIDEATHKKQINTELKDGDVLLNITGASIGRTTVVNKNVEGGNVNQHVCIIRLLEDYSPNYICNYLLSYGGQKQIDSFQAGGNREGLNFEQIRSIKFFIPSFREQSKIASLLSLLEERIATQNKIIEQLQSLIKGIRVRLFSFDNYDIKYLGDLCSITTGKLDANAMVENGKYPFFTCAEDTFRIDEYAFDTEALLISGNGANLGYIHYYNGKFNAYQRTYVLDKFSVEVMYLKYYLETFLNQRINQEVNVGNTPYIVLSTLTKMKIKIPDISLQRNIINVLSNLNLKLNQEKDILSAYQTQKAYLLRNLFI